MSGVVVTHATLLVEGMINAIISLGWRTFLSLLLGANLVFISFDVKPAEAWGLRVSRPPPTHMRLEPIVRPAARADANEPLIARESLTSRRDRFSRRDISLAPTTPGEALRLGGGLPPWRLGEVSADLTAAASPPTPAGLLAVLRFRAIREGADPAAPGFEKMLEDQLNLLAPIPGALPLRYPHALAPGAQHSLLRQRSQLIRS